MLMPSDGASVHGLDGLMVPYPRLPQQQLLPLDQNGYSTDLYRQGLTPPQLPGDHLHPYGRRAMGPFPPKPSNPPKPSLGSIQRGNRSWVWIPGDGRSLQAELC